MVNTIPNAFQEERESPAPLHRLSQERPKERIAETTRRLDLGRVADEEETRKEAIGSVQGEQREEEKAKQPKDTVAGAESDGGGGKTKPGVRQLGSAATLRLVPPHRAVSTLNRRSHTKVRHAQHVTAKGSCAASGKDSVATSAFLLPVQQIPRAHTIAPRAHTIALRSRGTQRSFRSRHEVMEDYGR